MQGHTSIQEQDLGFETVAVYGRKTANHLVRTSFFRFLTPIFVLPFLIDALIANEQISISADSVEQPSLCLFSQRVFRVFKVKVNLRNVVLGREAR